MGREDDTNFTKTTLRTMVIHFAPQVRILFLNLFNILDQLSELHAPKEIGIPIYLKKVDIRIQWEF